MYGICNNSENMQDMFFSYLTEKCPTLPSEALGRSFRPQHLSMVHYFEILIFSIFCSEIFIFVQKFSEFQISEPWGGSIMDDMNSRPDVV